MLPRLVMMLNMGRRDNFSPGTARVEPAGCVTDFGHGCTEHELHSELLQSDSGPVRVGRW